MGQDKLTIGPDQLGRLDHNRHFALEYYRDDREVRYLGFESAGLHKQRLPAAEFDARFTARLVDVPLDYTARSLLAKARRESYLPGDGICKLLTEIFIMAKTNGTGDFDGLSMKELMSAYNELAVAAGKPTMKEFKSKAEALKRIASLKDEASSPTPRQVAAAGKEDQASKAFGAMAAVASNGLKQTVASSKSAGRRKSGKVSNEAASTPKQRSEAAKKMDAGRENAKAKREEKAAGSKPRGLGIGAFCTDLIEKGESNEEILVKVRAKFPGAATSAASVAWYRNKVKSVA